MSKSLILVEGAQSSGKTTLVKALAEALHSSLVVGETARSVIAELKISDFELQNNVDDCFKRLQLQIFKKQCQREQFELQEDKINILDRSVISPLVYSLFYFKQDKELAQSIQASPDFERALQVYRKKALIILLSPDASIIAQDGVRKKAQLIELQQLNLLYRSTFAKHQLVFHQLHGLEGRLQSVLDLL